MDEQLAEILGIMLGDGCLYEDKKNKFHTIICFHLEEILYSDYVINLFSNYFDYSFSKTFLKNEILVRNVSKYVGLSLIDSGLIPGNKIKNKLDVPKLIFSKKEFMISFIRGLFDTDGCIYNKYGDYLQIQFKLGSNGIILSTYKLLILLGFHPTKIQLENLKKGTVAWKFYLSRQQEIHDFFRIIKPANQKHQLRYKKWGHWDFRVNARS